METDKGNGYKIKYFDIITKLLMGDNFLSTFSPAISIFFGYNKNFQIEDVAHIY